MKLYSAEEAEALAAAATPGPWCVGDDLIVWPADDVAVAFDTIGCAASYLDEALSRANAAIMAAAPDLARSVAHHARRADEAEAEVKRLEIEAIGVAYFACWPDGFLEALEMPPGATVDDLIRRVKALLEAEAEVARLRAIIAAERGLAAPEGWRPEGPGWLHLGDDEGHLDRYVWPDGRDTSAGKDRREGTWWGWVVDERADGRLTRSVRGLAPTALEAMEAADAAAGVTRG